MSNGLGLTRRDGYKLTTYWLLVAPFVGYKWLQVGHKSIFNSTFYLCAIWPTDSLTWHQI